jgi:vacuolar protein sorting-associated protein 18
MVLTIMLTGEQTASQRDIVLSRQAQKFFDDGRYFQAAQAYAASSASFEEVILKFIDTGERDALRSYLVSRLERTKKTVGGQLFSVLRADLMEFTGSHATNDARDLAGRVLSQQVQ